MGSLINLAEIRAGLRFASEVPRLLRHDISTAHARQALMRRLGDRRAEFLDLVRETIYENPGSPYMALLRQAGCEFGDLRKLVEDEDVGAGTGRCSNDQSGGAARQLTAGHEKPILT
jgi:hypothetical protein